MAILGSSSYKESLVKQELIEQVVHADDVHVHKYMFELLSASGVATPGHT